MEQHSRKQSVCNSIRVHCFLNWSSVFTTILHLQVKDHLFSLSTKGLLIFSTISLVFCILESLSILLSEDAESQDCLLSEGKHTIAGCPAGRLWEKDDNDVCLWLTRTALISPSLYPLVFDPAPSICVSVLCDCPKLPWFVSSDILCRPQVLFFCAVSCPFIPPLCVSATLLPLWTYSIHALKSNKQLAKPALPVSSFANDK